MSAPVVAQVTLSVSRNEMCWLLDALEAIIEDFEYDGGLILAEDYMALETKLRGVLYKHDRPTSATTDSPRRPSPAPKKPSGPAVRPPGNPE